MEGFYLDELHLYTLVKWFHILGISIGFGSNVTHVFWLISANVDAVNGSEKLRVVKKIDDRLSVPCYAVAISCGVIMWLWSWPLMSSWIIVSLVLSTILTVMGIAFGPFMKKWIKLADDQPESDRLRILSKRLTLWWISITSGVLFIIYMMIWKPTFW
jgi:uncharacterized membrane protein